MSMGRMEEEMGVFHHLKLNIYEALDNKEKFEMHGWFGEFPFLSPPEVDRESGPFETNHCRRTEECPSVFGAGMTQTSRHQLSKVGSSVFFQERKRLTESILIKNDKTTHWRLAVSTASPVSYSHTDRLARDIRTLQSPPLSCNVNTELGGWWSRALVVKP